MGWVGLTSLMDTDTAAARWDYPRLAECKRHRGGGYGNDTVSVVGRRGEVDSRVPVSSKLERASSSKSKFQVPPGKQVEISGRLLPRKRQRNPRRLAS